MQIYVYICLIIGIYYLNKVMGLSITLIPVHKVCWSCSLQSLVHLTLAAGPFPLVKYSLFYLHVYFVFENPDFTYESMQCLSF
jgi:hypothetical protein